MYEDALFEKFTDEELIGFRQCLAEEYREVNEETLEMMLDETLANMTPEEAEGFLSTLKKIGKAAIPVVSQVGQAALPTVGAAIGTTIAPGVGSTIGGLLGKAAAQSLSNVAKKSSKSKRASSRRGRSVSKRSASPRRRNPRLSSATKQILQLIQSPQFLQALASLNMGEQGRSAIVVASQEGLSSVPTGAFLNLLESLASQAAMEAAQNESIIPSYLENADGEALCDLANPDERARVLMERLQEDDAFYSEDWDDDEDDESDEAVLEWLEQAGLIEEPVF